MKEIEILENMAACEPAVEWLKTQKSYKQAWQDCQRGDWMLWLIHKIANSENEQELRRLTLAKARCAKLVLHLMQDERSKHAIEVAEAFGLGKATREELDAAATTAYAAADATYAAADAAAYADAAASAAAYAAAAYAAYAASAAAAAASAAARRWPLLSGAGAAKRNTLKKCADIVRVLYPKAPIL